MNLKHDKQTWQATVCGMWNAGFTQGEIADVLDVSRPTVSRYISKIGLTVTNARSASVRSMLSEAMKRVRHAEVFASSMSKRNNELEHLLVDALQRIKELQRAGNELEAVARVAQGVYNQKGVEPALAMWSAVESKLNK